MARGGGRRGAVLLRVPVTLAAALAERRRILDRRARLEEKPLDYVVRRSAKRSLLVNPFYVAVRR